MIFDDFSNLKLLIPLIVSFVGMTIVGSKILFDDFRKLSIKLKWLLAFVLIWFLGVVVGRIINGTFYWYYLLFIPIYLVLNILTTKLGKNKFIGQADLDIVNGIISLLIPVIIQIMNTVYESDLEVNMFSINLVHIYTVLMDLFTYILLGYIIAIVIALIRHGFEKIKNRNKEPKNDVSDKSLKEKVDEASIKATVKAMNLKNDAEAKYKEVEDAKKKGKKLRKRKIPICLAFFPAYYYIVYAALFLNLS